MRFAFDLDLPDERGDGLDGIWYSEKSDQRQTRVCQTRMHARTDSPNLGFTRQRSECLDRIIRNYIVKLSHQSLV